MDSPIAINGIPYLITLIVSMNIPKTKKQAQKVQPSKQNRKNKNATLLVAPVNQQVQKRIGAPQYLQPNRNDGSIRVRHREYVQDVVGSIAFSCISLPINPGMASVFQWLNTIASNYESYVAVEISFEYETMKSTATNGSLLMAVDYNGADPIPASKALLMSFNHAVRSPVWSECIYKCNIPEMRKIGPDRYVRTTALAANLDIKTYDIGQLFVATQGCADASVIGELYINYDIILQTPQAQTPVDPSLINVFQLINAFGSISRTNAFGNDPSILGSSLVSVSVNTITFLTSGHFLLCLFTLGTGVDQNGPALTGTANCGLASNLLTHNGGAISYSGASDGSTSSIKNSTTSSFAQIVVDVQIGETLIFTFTGNYTSLTGLTLTISNGWPTSENLS